MKNCKNCWKRVYGRNDYCINCNHCLQHGIKKRKIIWCKSLYCTVGIYKKRGRIKTVILIKNA